jgi:hypothetical protein
MPQYHEVKTTLRKTRLCARARVRKRGGGVREGGREGAGARVLPNSARSAIQVGKILVRRASEGPLPLLLLLPAATPCLLLRIH